MCPRSSIEAQCSDFLRQTPVTHKFLFSLIFTIYRGFCDKNPQLHYLEPSNKPCLFSLSVMNDPPELAFGFSYKKIIYAFLIFHNVQNLE